MKEFKYFILGIIFASFIAGQLYLFAFLSFLYLLFDFSYFILTLALLFDFLYGFEYVIYHKTYFSFFAFFFLLANLAKFVKKRYLWV